MLKVSDNKRYLVHDGGSPFFYLGDTAWELFYRLGRAETERYLADRAAKEFSVIEAVLLSEFGALERANAEGHLPLTDKDPARPEEAFFAHVDFVADKAAELGLWMGLLPTWGDKVGPKMWGAGPEVFTAQNARAYGEFLGRRYRDRPVIWILGGDRPVRTEAHRDIWRAMAAGIKAGDGGRGLMTFHPPGGHSSSEFVGGEDWLDFEMIQTGHGGRDGATYELVGEDYRRTPTRPTMEGEWCYENHPVNWKPELGRYDDWDVRKGLYWSLFAGGHGFTYGCNDIFTFYRAPEDLAVYGNFTPVLPWTRALDLPGAQQLKYARRLLLSRPYLTRIPDQELIASDIGMGADHVQATRDAEGRHAFVYVPNGRAVTVDLGRLSGQTLAACWYDPRTGAATEAGRFPAQGTQEFTPAGGADWVLVLDDAARDFPPPGNIRA
ncbi:MAG: glycoside hydrolase family 140 protein [Armatimonadetes bacterium]|nr:glycoside hydrolase family 140 protein [Armatimonadota bacterium]